MAAESAGDVVVPPTLQALLAARLDQLEPAERSVLERGAVEGEIFHRGAVQALAPEETQVTPRLAALVRKELIRPDRPQLAGEDGFRFRHILIRDAAYDSLPKATRAELHVRFAAWLEEHGRDLVELDEILGYHLEQGSRYRAELGLPSDAALTSTARRRLAAGGQRAALRQDYGAAASLLERAAALMPPAAFDLALETQLVEVLFWAGKVDEALRRADLAHRATTAGDKVGELCGRIKATEIRMNLEPEGEAAKLKALVEEALPFRGRPRRPGSVHRVLRAWTGGGRSRSVGPGTGGIRTGRRPRSRRAGGGEEFMTPFIWRAGWWRSCAPRETQHWELGSLPPAMHAQPASRTSSWDGVPWPASTERHPSPRCSRGWTRTSLARAATTGFALPVRWRSRCSAASRRGVRSSPQPEPSWQSAAAASSSRCSRPSNPAIVERLAGDPATAAALGAEGCRLLEEVEAQSFLSTAAAFLAGALYELGRLDEADTWAETAARAGDRDDLFTQLLWRLARAKILARRGALTDAEHLAREALWLTESTQDPERTGRRLRRSRGGASPRNAAG